MNEENPQVQMTWQKPLRVPGELKHYRVSWGRKGELMYSKVLSAIHYSFVTDKLGVYHSSPIFSDLRQVVGFLQVLRFPPPIKLTAII